MVAIVVFIVIAIWVVYLVRRNSPSVIGRSGERIVSRHLLSLDPARYRILTDLLLPSRGNSSATQIDHIVVSNHGIFCIETKALKGWIFGSAHQEQWTQVIFHYKGSFYNPLRQNFAHTKAIEGVLGARRLKRPIVGLVAFTEADRLAVSGTNSAVFADELVEVIVSYMGWVFSDAERDEIYRLLEAANIDDKESRRRHLSEVRQLR